MGSHFGSGLVLAIGLIVSSCSGQSSQSDYRFGDEDRDEIADLAADICHDTVSEHEKIVELEARIADLEARLGQ